MSGVEIGIVGSGMIGSSLAALFTGNGYSTTVYALNDSEADKCLKTYEAYYADLIANGLMTSAQAALCARKLTISQRFEDMCASSFVFECVVENLEVKYSVYHNIEVHCPNVRAIASSTSAMPAHQLAEGFGVYKDKFMVAHPWNPPHMVPCVEVVKSGYTGCDALDFCVELLKDVGRAPVVLQKSAPGFVANRLQQALYREAVYMVEQGIATPQDVDTSLKTSFAPRYTSIGIFEHYDYAGLDMIMSIQQSILKDLCNADEPQRLVREHFEKGELGAKTQKGILDWSNVDMDDFRRRASKPYLQFFNWKLPKG